MKTKQIFFRPYDKHGITGYHIPVRNSMNNRIEQEFIPSEMLKFYKTKYGETIISDAEFLDWYTDIAKEIQ